MFKINNNNQLNSGISIPMAIILSFCGMSIVFTYNYSVYNKYWNFLYNYAETKAKYNADSGIALEAVAATNVEFSLYDREFYVPAGESKVTAQGSIENMGTYAVDLSVDTNDNYQVVKTAKSTGYAKIENSLYGDYEVKYNRYLELSNTSSLSDFLYLTASERAGGAPYVFDNHPNSRREVNFGSGDSFNTGWPGDEPVCDVAIKTNGTFVMSDFGCPTFENTVTVIEDSDGNVNMPDMGFCNENQVFQGDPPLDTASVTCLPPPGYDAMKTIVENSNDHIFLDATTKLNGSPTYFSRDTLVMTDIEFITENGGGIKVKQWWFLMPPYLSVELPWPTGAAIDPGNCTNSNLLYTCDKYIESMQDFHAKNVTNQGNDFLIDPIVQSTYGFHHYDFPDIHNPNHNNPNWISQLNNSHLLPEYQNDGHVIYYTSEPTAIYVKGGPVRVHGTYNGRFTVVTDEYITYDRHAWGNNVQGGLNRVDTLWCNIWITDDIVNADASWNNNLLNAQPDENCENGSDNILGLVSGANVYVANTPANGARNCTQGGCDVNIHAHIIAFKESFAVQYFQNDISTTNYQYSNPPYADGQGRDIYGNGLTIDARGDVNLWGGIVQKYRGYTVRNNPGPYPTNDIGMDKNYNFDCNLKCAYPPLYPENTTCDEDDSEINYTVSKYF